MREKYELTVSRFQERKTRDRNEDVYSLFRKSTFLFCIFLKVRGVRKCVWQLLGETLILLFLLSHTRYRRTKGIGADERSSGETLGNWYAGDGTSTRDWPRLAQHPDTK